jgi:Fe-S-cluster containining protein
MPDQRNGLIQTLAQIDTGDRQLLAGIADAMGEAARRSGAWLVCGPECTECCLGPFAITQLDALRLRRGLLTLEAADPAGANRVRERSAQYTAAIAPEYPGDPVTGELLDEDSLPARMDDTPCPALDPDTGLCDLYAARPVTCRTFGPVTRAGEAVLGACELCYAGASGEEMARCAVDIDCEGLEGELLAKLESAGSKGMTIVAYALAAEQHQAS